MNTCYRCSGGYHLQNRTAMYLVKLIMSLRMGVVKSFICFFCLVSLIHLKMSPTEEGSPASRETNFEAELRYKDKDQ